VWQPGLQFGDGGASVTDYFLKLDGIPGESTDHKHKGEIDLESFSWGETNVATPGRGGGMGAGKVAMQDLHFTARVNKASPTLFLSCATGKHIKEAVLTARKAGKDQQEYLIIKLKEVFITSYQIGGAEAAGDVPMDQVSFNFSKIDYEYRAQKPDGSLGPATKASYDVKKNKPA
jgi:type VI secretion system secreted protein Hcp